jgi:ABC-type dipeptide/oligopeptide/nickel transport system permease subunit
MDTTETERVLGTASPEQIEEIDLTTQQSVSPIRAAFRRFLRDKRAVACLAILLIMSIGSFIFPLIYSHLGPTMPGGISGTTPTHPSVYHQPGYQDLNYSDVPGTLLPLGPKSWFHPLGTNTNGQDMLAQLMAGLNISVELALMVEVVDITLGIFFGTLAGWYGGWLGVALDRFTDIMFSFPSLLLIILMGITLGPLFDKWFHPAIFARMLLLTMAIGLIAWPLMMRFVRGQTLNLKSQQFVEAARTVGTSDIKIILRHIIPNLLSIVIVASTLDMLTTIVSEAGISLLGVGIRPPGTSIGLMISQAFTALDNLSTASELIFPCLTLVIVVVCFSFVGDGVRDAFDPRTKD